MEEAKNGILVKWQEVFDAGLDKTMSPICHETPQDEMAHIIRVFHQS